MKSLRLAGLVFIFSLVFQGKAQEANDPEKVIRQVYEVLAGMHTYDKTEMEQNLKKGAWEALSYVEEADTIVIEDLSEAVPDYYRFREGKAVVKLINPQNYNEYGMEAAIPYRLTPEGEIQLINDKTGAVKDSWKIIYVDGNYLALDMGDLRVFFTHTPVQE